jgi:transcriptional regulator NrdR family protein
MKCPQCGAATAVLETRPEHAGIALRRRRQCPHGHKFNTQEVVVGVTIGRIKKQWAAAKAKDALAKRDAEIVRRIKAGEKRYMLAEEYGLSPASITRIATRAKLPRDPRGQRK